jgi:hypothetical protein
MQRVNNNSASASKKTGNQVELRVPGGSSVVANKCVVFAKKGTKSITYSEFKNFIETGSIFIEHHCASTDRFTQKACFQSKPGDGIPCRIVELSERLLLSKREKATQPLKLTRSVAASTPAVAN